MSIYFPVEIKGRERQGTFSYPAIFTVEWGILKLVADGGDPSDLAVNFVGERPENSPTENFSYKPLRGNPPLEGNITSITPLKGEARRTFVEALAEQVAAL